MPHTLAQLRLKHPRFLYERASWEVTNTSLWLRFFFKIEPELEFVTTWEFTGIDPDYVNGLPPNVLDNWVFQLGMVEALSYWKATCSPEFVIEAGSLSADQLKFWHKLLQNGLSEFFYVNKIDGWASDFVRFLVKPNESQELNKEISLSDTAVHPERVLIPVGGGKDSAVVMELLKQHSLPVSTITINKNPQVANVLDVAGLGGNIELRRTLDPKLSQLNADGYLNGHTPFSALLAFATTFAALIYNYRYVVLSNEHSASEANIVFNGHDVNHQYSKSLEFESDFRAYLHANVSQTVEYFSLLRPLTELKIAELFSRNPQYWPVFLSCNRGQKTGRWCGECPKCLFVFLMLSPFISSQELEQIWGQNLLKKESLLETFLELAGVHECKSFECVGLREETVAAAFLTIERQYYQELPFLLKFAQENLLQNNVLWHQKSQELLATFAEPHHIPDTFLPIIKSALTQKKT